MDELPELVNRRRLTLAVFGIVTVFLFSGFALGPSGNDRGAFVLEGDETWDAAARAAAEMPEHGHGVPLFIGPRWDTDGGNVLALSVLRELVERHDAVMADPEIAEHFDPRYHWMVQTEVSGPWAMAETVRMVMDQQSPVSAQIGWNGSDFASANEADLTDLLTRLFDFETPDGSRPYMGAVSKLQQLPDGSWDARAFFIFGTGNATSLFGPEGEYSKVPGDVKPFFEQWEVMIDEVYMQPMDDTGEDVHVWSYLAIDTEVDDEVNMTLPLVGVIFVLMVIVLGVFFRDWRDVLAASAGLGLLMGWMFSTQAWMGYPITQVSSMLPILLLALGVDFSFHSLHRWRAIADRDGGEPRERLAAAWTSIRELRPALGLATVTTMIAFGTAAFSSIPDLAEWGRLAVIYIFEAYLLLGIFTVVLRSGMAVKSGDPQQALAAKMRALAGSQSRKPLPFVLVLLLLTAGALVIGQPDSDFDVHDYLDNDSRMVRSLDIAKTAFEEGDSGEPGFVLVEAGGGGDLASHATLGELDSLMSDLHDRNWTYDDSTIIDVLRWQVAFNGVGAGGFTPSVIDAATGLPTSSDELRLVLLDIMANGTMDPADPRSIITAEGAAELAAVDPESGELGMLILPIKVGRAEDWVWMEQYKEDMQAVFDEHLSYAGGEKVTLTGISYQRYVYVNAMTGSFQTSIYLAIGACLVVLFLVFRDIRLSLITIAPVVAVSLWLYAGMELTGTSLNLVTLQVASLAIGLGLDYAVHVTQAIREQKELHPDAGMKHWVEGMMGHTGTALFASGVTDTIGFAVLLLSVMPMFTMFGRVMIAMVILAQAACLFGLPALLTMFGKLEDAPENDAVAAETA